MKYLQLHKLIWLILVLTITFIELVFVAISYVFYVIWNFKLSFPFTETWKELHHNDEFVPLNEYTKIIKVRKSKTDKSFKDTIIRRYHILF